MASRDLFSQFTVEEMNEVAALQAAANPRETASFRDMRDRDWISIDNEDSLDLDQLTYAEKSGPIDRIFVAVSDVDALVKKGSAIDRYASHNTTSVYTPAKVFPMLPPQLSNDLTSLRENEDRSAIVTELTVDPNGQYELVDVYPAWVKNQAKLAYPSVGEWLSSHVYPVSLELQKQIELQDQIAEKIERFRTEQGALGFATLELKPVIVEGTVVRLERQEINPAHKVIENFMIAANVCMTRFLMEWNLPVMRRIVRVPKRWSRIVELARNLGDQLPNHPNVKALRDFLMKQNRLDPESFFDLSISVIKLLGRGEYTLGAPGDASLGHFDLALRDYAHTTAPNRRFPDLVMQRILKSHVYGESVPYRRSELIQLASHCTKKEDDAMKVERRLNKCAAAILLVKQIGHVFPAIVTGASPKGTWVRVVDPPIEGKLVKGFKGLDVHDRLQVKLIHVDVHNGHIDFGAV